MKAFTTYLTESTRTYDFRIRIACNEMSNDIVSKIKQVLEAYKVDSISSPKRLPIQETPEFPNMGPVEINMMDVKLCYPVTDAQVRALIAECGCVPANCIRVTPTNSPYEAALAGLEQSNLQKAGESVLENPEMTTSKPPADLVGDARIPSLIKEFAGMKKYEMAKAEGGAEKDKSAESQGTTNKLPMGQQSPIGTHQNKIPVAKKMPAGNGR